MIITPTNMYAGVREAPARACAVAIIGNLDEPGAGRAAGLQFTSVCPVDMSGTAVKLLLLLLAAAAAAAGCYCWLMRISSQQQAGFARTLFSRLRVSPMRVHCHPVGGYNWPLDGNQPHCDSCYGLGMY